MARPVVATVVDDETAEPRAATGDILRAGDDLDVYPEIAGTEGREWHDGGVGNEGHASIVGNPRERTDVGHEELRIGDDFEEQGTGLVVDEALHPGQVGEVGKARLHP